MNKFGQFILYYYLCKKFGDMRTDKLCIDDYVIISSNGSYVKIDAITNRKIGYHRNGAKPSTHLAYARRDEIEPIELNLHFFESLGLFEITKSGDAIYKSEDGTVHIRYSNMFGTVRIYFDNSDADMFFGCEYFHTLINVLKCMSEVHEEANAVLAAFDEAMSNLIKKNNEKA